MTKALASRASDAERGAPAPARPPNFVAKAFDRFGAVDLFVSRHLAARKQQQFRTLPQRSVLPVDTADIGERCATVNNALLHNADERTVRAIIGVMLDGIPAAASQISTTYIDAITQSVRMAMDEDETSLSAFVLCSVVKRIWLDVHFAPDIGDIVITLRKCRDDYATTLRDLCTVLEEIAPDAKDLPIYLASVDRHALSINQHYEALGRRSRS